MHADPMDKENTSDVEAKVEKAGENDTNHQSIEEGEQQSNFVDGGKPLPFRIQCELISLERALDIHDYGFQS